MKAQYDFIEGKRGPVARLPSGKTRITIRLDNEVIEWFRGQVEAAGGGNYQTLLNEALKEHVRLHQEPLEVVVRRIVREELRSTR
ncbi:MAG: BrnA antitoxin family protein [Chloroflexi bacterium]|nr:BrnA antitoxin family protein [Chloroflexota bacterium]